MKKTTKIVAVAMILAATVSTGAFARSNNKSKNKNWNDGRQNEKFQNCPNCGKQGKEPGKGSMGNVPMVNGPMGMGQNMAKETIKGTLTLEGNKENPLIKLVSKDGNVYAVNVIGDRKVVVEQAGKTCELTGILDKANNIILIRTPKQPAITVTKAE